jgi:DNA-binding PadR family transcriptional regulator
MKLLTRQEELILLSILRLGEKAYCVPIFDHIENITGEQSALGSIYITLHRLEKRGHIESQFGTPTPERGGKSKRFYRVTDSGKKALQTIKHVEEAMWEGLSSRVFD